tara:strand:- start:1281 stop:1634 length:354 start_codon:yes stop_codon:yes gene_type:complete
MKEQAIEQLKEHMKPGDTIHTELAHVTRSGMTRFIKVRQIKDNYPFNFTRLVANALGWKYSDRYQAIKVGGCGMDMGFHLIYCLGQVLWPEGTPEPHGIRNGEPDSCGGYALKHRWL